MDNRWRGCFFRCCVQPVVGFGLVVLLVVVMPLSAFASTDIQYIGPGDAGATSSFDHHGALEDACGSAYSTTLQSLFSYVTDTVVGMQSAIYKTYVDRGYMSLGYFRIYNNSGQVYYNSNYFGSVYGPENYGQGVVYNTNVSLTYSNSDAAISDQFAYASISSSGSCAVPDDQALGHR